MSILKILNVKNLEAFETLKNFEIEAFEHFITEAIDTNLLKALSDKVLGKMTFKFGLLVLLILNIRFSRHLFS